MEKFISLLLCVLLLVPTFGIGEARAAEPVKKPLRILAIGNSYSNNATMFIDEIAANLGYDVEAYSLYKDGCSLEQHVQYYNNESQIYALTTKGENLVWGYTMQKALNEREYDIVTIQQAPGIAQDFSTYWTEEKPLLTDLYAIIKKHQPAAKIMIHQTWSFCEYCTEHGSPWYNPHKANSKEMFLAQKAAYEKASEKIGNAEIIPAGEAIQLAKDEFGYGDFHNDFEEGYKPTDAERCANGALYNDYVDHLNIRGRYLASCVWLEKILGADTRKTTVVPEPLTEEDCKVLRSVAHETVTGEADSISGDWRYVKNGDGIKITHYIPENILSKKVIVPTSIGGKKVNSLAGTAFKYVGGDGKVILPAVSKNWDIDKNAFSFARGTVKQVINSESFDTAVNNNEGMYFAPWSEYLPEKNPRTENFLIDPNLKGDRPNATVYYSHLNNYDSNYLSFSNKDHTNNGGNSIKVKKRGNTIIEFARLFGKDKKKFTAEDLGRKFDISFFIYLESSTEGTKESFNVGLIPVNATSNANSSGHGFYQNVWLNANVGEWKEVKFTVTLDEKNIGPDQIGLLGVYFMQGKSSETPTVFYIDDINVTEIKNSVPTVENNNSNIKGDVNNDGKVNASDLAILKKLIAGLIDKTDESVINPDVDNKPGNPNAADLAVLKKIVAGIAGEGGGSGGGIDYEDPDVWTPPVGGE